MLKLNKVRLACAVIIAIVCAGYAYAFSTSHYVSQSKLAMGRWVKISIPESGVYEITYDEMRAMGFNDPTKVHVYGVGGNRINEKLNGSAVDDLKQVPILRTNNKICFYGNGPVSFSIKNTTTTPHYVREFNPYSQVGCYLLTEEFLPDVVPSTKSTVNVTTYINSPTSLAYYYHESELMSVTVSGKDMLGEEFSRGHLLIDYNLPNLADSSIIVHTAVAANPSELCYVNAVIHSAGATDTTAYDQASSRISAPTIFEVHYNSASPFGVLKLTNPAEQGQFEPILNFLSPSAYANFARLDYFILTYRHENVLAGAADNQILMGNGTTRGNERFMIPNAPSGMVVWYINNTNAPMLVRTKAYNDEAGQGQYFYSAPLSYSNYVAFDPTKTLKKITGFEPVANQNLHSMAVPDLLIITVPAFVEQAERLADMHRAVDGIDVAIVTQDQVFNEFSSGTRDAMAYRLLCKMLFDRDSVKFKNLLLFGTGSFDNRELMGSHPDDLLTFQSDNSNFDKESYTSDDFFGFLEDNSGAALTSDKLSIGVGRITCVDVDEARSDVDKIIEYYANPDYGVWRNNTLVISDSPDNGEFLFEGQGYKNQIDNELNTGMQVNTVHNSMYPRSTTEVNFEDKDRTATEAKLQIAHQLKAGAYYATYVGHAGPIAFTKTNKMWTTGDVARTTYPHYPIMSTACCDVAHYDNDSRGIAELMFHQRNGGAVALLTPSRMVYSDGNDLLNKYFINSLFSNDREGRMPTLGEAYKNAKCSFTAPDVNKMPFFLLGDPAMRINYPISRFVITSVNGTDVTDTLKAEISPLCKFRIVAKVISPSGRVDNSFNGDATITLYDREDLFTTLSFKYMGEDVERDIYMDRPKLAEISGRVVNGTFSGTMIAPKSPLARNQDVMIRVYAHKDGTDYMVNGFTKQVTMLPFNESVALHDSQSPVINAMYVNDEMTFADGALVAPNSILYINVSDNEGISMQSNSIDKSMKLQLDGGKATFADVTCYANVASGGKVVNIEFPLSNLSEGLHTLTYTVFDMVGNSAKRTISFLVGQTSIADLTADKLPAFRDGEVAFDAKSDLTLVPDMIIRVTDATGKLMWMTTTSTFPVTWDMTDMNGNKVPAGLYRYFGTYNDGVYYGGTAIKNLIVLDPVKSKSTKANKTTKN